jgi:hypothetical protein
MAQYIQIRGIVMKRRVGFVSNSSSCSFVVNGLKIKKDYSILEKLVKTLYPKLYQEYIDEYAGGETSDDVAREFLLEEELLDIFDDDETGYSNKDYMVIGDLIAHINEEMMDSFEIDLDDPEKPESIIKVIKVLDKLGIEYKRVIIGGTMMC